MPHIWDYDEKELEKTDKGRIIWLEKLINYGPKKGEKIPLADVKKYWNILSIDKRKRNLLELIIWDKYQPSSPNNKSSFYPFSN